MTVRWTEYALAQLLVLVDHPATHRGPAAQKRIIIHLLTRVAALADLPWAGPEWRVAADATFRRLVVDEHVVLYRVVAEEEAVVVLAVRHGRQRPLDPNDVPSR